MYSHPLERPGFATATEREGHGEGGNGKES